jgi:hypothetical protein
LATATEILDARATIPAHLEGWAHLTQGPDSIVAAFEAASGSRRPVMLTAGERVDA